jgi:hypothetical protein
MPWIPLSVADIEARVPSNVLATLRERYNLEGSDPLALLITDAVARVRQSIATCDDYTLDSNTTTIPAELREDACWLVIANLAPRVPEVYALTDAHRDRIKSAEDRLKEVAACRLAISAPETAAPVAVQITGGATLVSSKPRRNTRETLSGLF